jgi:hypothetical protein
MNRESYKSKRKGQPKRSRQVTKAKEWTPITTPKLCQIYATQTEWATKKLPKLKEPV